IRTMMRVFLDPGGITREGMRQILQLQLFDPRMLTDEMIDERLAVALTQPKRVLTSLSVPHLLPLLPEIACPVFALWGVDDKSCPARGVMAIAERCSRSRVLLLSACGHWVMVEHAGLFNRLAADFLDEPP